MSEESFLGDDWEPICISERSGFVIDHHSTAHTPASIRYLENKEGVQARIFNGRTTIATGRHNSKEEAMEALVRLLFKFMIEQKG